jgi:hypothetical protein
MKSILVTAVIAIAAVVIAKKLPYVKTWLA